MSSNEACPGGTSQCVEPLTLSCSFKGCTPLIAHDASFNVNYLGGEDPSFRKSKLYAFCGENPPEIMVKYELSDNNFVDLILVESEECTDPDDGKFKLLKDIDTKEGIKIDSYTCLGSLTTDPSSTTCFGRNTSDCEGNSVSMRWGDCNTGCLPYVIDPAFTSDATFMWTDTEPKLLASDLAAFGSIHLAENWKDSTYKDTIKFELQCDDSQEWISINPRLIKLFDLKFNALFQWPECIRTTPYSLHIKNLWDFRWNYK